MTSEPKTSRTINVTLWIAQVILALSFVWSAMVKWFQSADKLAEMWPWTANNTSLVKLTGVLDLLAGIGLILPALLSIQPRLTIYAAYATIALMMVASIFHIVRGEASQIGVNIFFAVLAAFIAWGRQKKAPITTKT